MDYTLTVYREDDSTVWFEVGTDPSHPAPYLHEPGEIDAGEVDFLQGRATIGQVNLRVIDVQTGASQAERWLTERLGIPAGEEGEGHTALIGRRALYRRNDTVIMDGVIYSVTLSESFAGFELQVRDIRERSRKVRLFDRTGTATILPRGVLNGYGVLPGGGFLVPPTVPLTATFRMNPPRFDFTQHWSGTPIYDTNATVPPTLVFTEHMAEATKRIDDTGRFLDVRLLWRPVGQQTWNVLDAPRGSGSIFVGGFHLLNTWRAKLRDAGQRNGEEVQGIINIVVAPGQTPLPNDGQDVEVVLVYTGPATEHYPFHFEGTAGELLKNIYDGLYSPRDESGNIIPTGVRYDEAAVLALTTPVRLRVTEPVEDMREWTERYVYRAIGAAPALDAQGRISPVRAALPPDGVTLPEITDENAAPLPGWDHDASTAVNIVQVEYWRDFLIPPELDPRGEASAGDGLTSRKIIVERQAPASISLLGPKAHKIDGEIFRALGGSDGGPLTGDVRDETGARVADQRAVETLDRWVFGGQISACRLVAPAFRNLRVGDWVIDSRSWRPNYATGQRGGSRLAQVVSVRQVNPAWLEVVLVDGGPSAVPLGQPTLGTLTVDSDGVVSVPVIAVPAGGEAAVYYAVSATQPAPDSGSWTFLGRTATPATLATPALPAGATVWVRARGEAAGRRPSPYTAALSIVIPATPRVSGVRILIDDGVATVIWQPNQVAAGVRIYWDIHPRGVPPTYATADVEAGVGAWTVPETMPVGAALTVEVEPWTGWTGTAVSGTAGPRVITTAIYDLGGPPREVPFNDGKFAVVALDPAGQVLDPSVTDAGGREVVRFFAKAAPDAPDTADAIPDGTTKRVTTIDEAAGGGRAFQGLLSDGTVAPGKIRRDFPFADGKYAVTAQDPSGQVLDAVVKDAGGREVRKFFAKESADQPDTADAIPDGVVKRVTTIDEAEGGGRAVKGLLQDGTVAPGKVVATSIQDGAVIRQKIATGAVAAEHIQAGAISDAHYSGSPADKLATVKVRFPPTVEVVANEPAGQVQRDITVTIRDPDNGRVRFWWRVVTTPSDSYTTPAPTSSGALQTQPYTATVRVDRAAVDSFFEFWGEDEDGNRSAIVRVPIPPLENPDSLMDPPTIMTTLGSTCPSQLVDILTWPLAGGLPAGWRVEVWIIEGTQTGNPFAGVRLSSNASPPFQTTRLQNVRSALGSQYQRTYGLRLVNSHGIVVDEDTNGRADGYDICPT